MSAKLTKAELARREGIVRYGGPVSAIHQYYLELDAHVRAQEEALGKIDFMLSVNLTRATLEQLLDAVMDRNTKIQALCRAARMEE